MADNNQDEQDNKQTPPNKKPNRGPRVPVWLLATGMAVTLVGGGVLGYTLHPAVSATRQSVGQSQTQTAGLPEGFNQVLATYQTIQQNYFRETSPKKLANGAISGMLGSLNDPYSVYLQNDNKSSLDDELSASFGGIGATVQQGEHELTIESILPGTPAKKAGMQVGDKLLKVNGKSVADEDVNTAVSKIRGKIGTKVSVTVERGGKPLTLNMKRAKITTDTVTGELAPSDKKIGIITMATFSAPTADQFEKTVKSLRKKGATKFILDLRGNPGGMLDQAQRIASMCLKNGQTIVQVEDRSGKREVYKAGKNLDKGFKVTEPIAILMDGNSASASEILSAALHDNRNVPLIGEKSFGKGTVQTVAPLSKTAEVKLTIAKWLTPKGAWINHKGLRPTDKVAYPAYAKISGISAASLKVGDESGDVRSLQQVLKALGEDPHTDNGYYGPSTQKAIKAYQAKKKLPQTGKADSKTLSNLMIDLSTKFHNDDPQKKAAIKLMEK